MGNGEARQIVTGEYPDEGSSNPTTEIASEATNQLSNTSIASDQQHTVKEPTDLETDDQCLDMEMSPTSQSLRSSVRVQLRIPGSSSQRRQVAPVHC